MTSLYYVYMDETFDGRVFYIGLGNEHRLRRNIRNKKHGIIAEKYGCLRSIIMITESREEAYRCESFSIGRYGTFIEWLDIGCNLTLGGTGTRGHKHSCESKKQMSISAKKRPSNRWGKTFTQESKEKMRLAQEGEKSAQHIGFWICGEHGRFPSMKLAAKAIGIVHSTVYKRCKGNDPKFNDWFFEPKEK